MQQDSERQLKKKLADAEQLIQVQNKQIADYCSELSVLKRERPEPVHEIICRNQLQEIQNSLQCVSGAENIEIKVLKQTVQDLEIAKQQLEKDVYITTEHFAAQLKASDDELALQEEIIGEMCEIFSVSQEKLVETAQQFRRISLDGPKKINRHSEDSTSTRSNMRLAEAQSEELEDQRVYVKQLVKRLNGYEDERQRLQTQRDQKIVQWLKQAGVENNVVDEVAKRLADEQ